jgi:hypothetical protein
MSDDPRERIRSLLVKIGDERKKVAGNLKGSVAIMKEDIGEHRDTIMISLIECAKYLPTKPGIYGTWLALMNPDNRVFVSDTINGLYSELRYAITDGNLEISCCLLRVLIECANAGCVSVSSVVTLIRNLYTASCASGFSNGDFGLYLVGSSLCWFSPNLARTNSEVMALIDEIVQGMEAWVSTPSYQSRKEIVSALPGFPDQLESSIAAIKKMQLNGWETEVLIRPYLMEGISLPSLEAEFIHTIPSYDASLCETVVTKKFIPSVFYRSSSVSLSEADHFLLEETMASTMQLFGLSVGECSKALLRIPFLNPSFETVLSDVIVSKSVCSHAGGFYQSTMHRVMLLQESVKPCFEATVSGMFSLDLSPDTQFALTETVVFACLNNIPVSGLADKISIEKFISLAVRLMPVNMIQTKLGLTYELPEPSMGNPFEPSDDYSRVRESVRIKDGSEVEVIELLLNRLESREAAFSLFVQALIENGSRTITHFTRLLEMFQSIIHRSLELNLVSSIEQRELILVSKIFTFWSNNSFRLESSLNQLLNANLVSVHSIITSMPIDAESLTTYKLIELVLGFLLRKRKSLNEAFQENNELGEAEYMLSVTASTLLANCPESVKKWIVRNYHSSLDKTTVNCDMLTYF